MVVARPFYEFEGNKRLLWIAEEWERYADDLAEWTMQRLVNRRDVWSQYTIRNGEIRVVMLPIRERRVKGSHMITMKKLKRHYTGHSPAHLIGLHSISDHSTCKWFAVDIDLHDESVANADEIAGANFTAAHEWANRLRELGMDPIIFDSNGVGGYHVWALLDREYPLADTFKFVSELRSDYDVLGLPRKPEVFPPKGAVEDDDLPYGLRLPGRHHTRPYYSRVWNFDAVGENEWLEGGEAIEAMLAVIPAPLPNLATIAPHNSSEVKATGKPKGKKKAAAKRKPRVCLDLDGVLAHYEGWEGLEIIGSPLPGAQEFARSVAKFADIIIFSSRCSLDVAEGSEVSRLSPGQLRILIIDWLEKNEMPYTDVYVGQGKPRAAAFVDDRAVVCRPQEDDSAYDDAIDSLKLLLKKRSRTP